MGYYNYFLVQAGTLAVVTLDGKNNIDGEFGNGTDLALYEFRLKHPETYVTSVPNEKARYNTRNALKE